MLLHYFGRLVRVPLAKKFKDINRGEMLNRDKPWLINFDLSLVLIYITETRKKHRWEAFGILLLMLLNNALTCILFWNTLFIWVLNPNYPGVCAKSIKMVNFKGGWLHPSTKDKLCWKYTGMIRVYSLLRKCTYFTPELREGAKASILMSRQINRYVEWTKNSGKSIADCILILFGEWGKD